MVSYTITPTIVGFFNDTSTLISSSSKISENEMYLPLVDLLALQGLTEEDVFTITTAKYYLDDPLNINDFVVDATSSYTEISSGQLTFNDVNYDAIVEPIQNVSDFADIFLISVSIGSVVILSLLIFNALKDRKYEIGVLLSLGEEKIKIIMQYIVELLVIASMVFLLSAFSSNFISAQVGAILIQNEITELDEQNSETTQAPKGVGGSLSIVSLENLEYVDELNVNVTFNDFIITLGIGFAIIIVSSAIPSFYITRYNPKTILSSRN
jgi:putative ABC transport system permease protein